MTVAPQQQATPSTGSGGSQTNLADILERVLDRGLIIAGDIRISLLDIELLTVKLRLLIASVDTAQQLGIDWWRYDPWLSSGAVASVGNGGSGRPEVRADGQPQLAAVDADDRRRRSGGGTGDRSRNEVGSDGFQRDA